MTVTLHTFTREDGTKFVARVAHTPIWTGYEVYTLDHADLRFYRTPDFDPPDTQRVHGWPPAGAPALPPTPKATS